MDDCSDFTHLSVRIPVDIISIIDDVIIPQENVRTGVLISRSDIVRIAINKFILQYNERGNQCFH